MSLTKQAKDGFNSNATQMMILSNMIMQQAQGKKELDKKEYQAMHIAALCAQNVLLGTLVQAIVSNMEESNIMLAKSLPLGVLDGKGADAVGQFKK